MKIVYGGIDYNEERIKSDLEKLKNNLTEARNSVVLHAYQNEYVRAIGVIASFTERIRMLSISSLDVPAWIYPYCHYKIEGLEGAFEKLDGDQQIAADGIQLAAVLGETIRFLSLSERGITEYKQNLLNLQMDYSAVFIPVNLINVTLTLALITAFDLDKEIIFYKSVDDIKQYTSANEGKYLLYVNGLQINQMISAENQWTDQISGIIICDIPMAGQALEPFKGQFANKYIYCLDISMSNEIIFRLYIDLLNRQYDDIEYINLEGVRVEIGYIENCIATYPLINKNTVTVQMDPSGVYKLISFYMIAQKNNDELGIKQYLFQKLPWYAVPEQFVHITELPIRYDLKVDKKQLPSVLIGDLNDNIEIDGSIQKEAINLLVEYIKREVDEGDLNKPIESLGINSLLFIEYIVSLEDRIGFEMPDNMLDIMLFKNMRHLLSYITSIIKV